MIAKLKLWLRGAAALAVIAALAGGVPWLLLTTVGNPLPSQGWSWSEPLTDSAILALLAVLAWLFWAQLMVCLIVEVVAEIRLAAGRSADWKTSIPGTFGGQQQLARVLVQAVIAVGVGAGVAAGPAVTGVVGAAAVDRIEPAVSEQLSVGNPSAARADQDQVPAARISFDHDRQRTKTVEVSNGDTLWTLAERFLGSGEQWRRIADLNEGRMMPDGERFVPASSIRPGWRLRVPAEGSEGASIGTHHGSLTVVRGDTLWGLAEDAYGNGEAWPRLYEANRDQIADPDLIFPGQVLEIPDEVVAQPVHPSTEPEQPSTPEHTGDSVSSELPDSTQPASPGTVGPIQSSGPTTASPEPQSTSRSASQADSAGDGYLTSALVGGGGLLAGGALVMLIAHRRRQFRVRNSGRTIASTPDHLMAAEKALLTTGSAGGVSASFLDRALRDLSSRLAQSGGTLPEIAAVRLGEDRLDLLLAVPMVGTPPGSWSDDGTRQRWSIARGVPLEASDALAPYPALVAIGVDDDGATWLLDLETAGLLQLQGDRTASQNLARFMAAELAMNVWSDNVDVTLPDFAEELVTLNPARLRHQQLPDVADLVMRVQRVDEAMEALGCDVLAGRLDGRGADTWMPKILLFDAGSAPDRMRDDVERLLDELANRPGRSAVALVLVGDGVAVSGGTTLAVDRDRRLTLTPWNVRLTANQLTVADSQTLASLLAAGNEADDEPMPPAPGAQPYKAVADAAGALRVELTEPRDGGHLDDSMLPLPDERYVKSAATTVADLAALAPVVPRQMRDRVLALDESLDDDLVAWSDPDTPRPRLRLLGPVELHAAGERTPEVDRRRAYFTEIVAYLATRDHGATPEQTALAFDVQTNTIHSRVGTARKWLGSDPTTGWWYLPESTLSPSAKSRGVPVYEVIGLLSDADLFKRLRVRGQAGGSDGISDRVTALRLVDGVPFDQLRPGGYGWLADTPLDQYLTAGVVDVAHIVATQALASGELELALWACETAIAAAPAEDKPRLDLTAVLVAQGRSGEVAEHLARTVFNRSDDEGAPPLPSGRTAEVLAARGWLNRVK